MKTRLAVLALALATSAWAETPRAPKPAPWLVAQYDRQMPVCRNDDRDVPSGTRLCRDGAVWVCSGRGTWESTGKPC